jgi:hypothetical protein
MNINDTLFWFLKFDACCLFCPPHTWLACDNMQRGAVGDCLTDHNLADALDQRRWFLLTVWKHEHDSNLAVSHTLVIFPSSTLYHFYSANNFKQAQRRADLFTQQKKTTKRIL